MKFGLIGYGRFGKLWADVLKPYGEVIIYDKNHNELATLEDALKVDILFIIVPISQFENCCQEIKDKIKVNVTIVDVCSVKKYPIEVMQSTFPNNPLIGTHPLFGPDSVAATGGLKGHRIVMCHTQHKSQSFEALQNILKQIGLEIITTTADDHDLQMAKSQGLIHFIGRGLNVLELKPQQIATPDYQSLLKLNKMVVNDTWQLFFDMQRYNPYTKAVREDFIQQLNKLNDDIEQISFE